MSEHPISIRALRPDDLEPVIALDQSHSGQSRRGFFEHRLAAALQDVHDYIGLAAEAEGRIEGFALAHLLDGEFGSTAPVAVLDAMGVARGDQGFGIGSRLLEALLQRVRQRGARELQTQADWRQPGLLEFFARSGFVLAPRIVLERGTEAYDF